MTYFSTIHIGCSITDGCTKSITKNIMVRSHLFCWFLSSIFISLIAFWPRINKSSFFAYFFLFAYHLLEWTTPVALAGIYCTPTEHIFCNIVSNTIGVVVMRSNLFTTCLWLTHAMLRTLANHSGYKFPFYYDPRQHDYHHLK